MKRTPVILLLSLFTSTACVQFDVKQSLSATNSALPEFTNGNLELLISEDQKKSARERTDELLAAELSLSSAIEVALQNSPAVQAMLTEYWEQSSDIACLAVFLTLYSNSVVSPLILNWRSNDFYP